VFIGHYGASFVAKKLAPKLSLGVYFVAAQVLDVLFSIFVLLGIEKMRLVPGFTETNNYDLYYMPYTHSLVGAVLWGFVSAAIVFAVVKCAPEAIAFGGVVISHFLFDIPVHTPDLPLLGNDSTKIGFGLWRHWYEATALELLFIGIGLAIYWRQMKPVMDRDAKKRTQITAFSAVLVLLTIATPFLPQPTSGASFAGQALFGYAVLAFVAARVDGPLSKTKTAS
jgi:hypothetical protein